MNTKNIKFIFGLISLLPLTSCLESKELPQVQELSSIMSPVVSNPLAPVAPVTPSVPTPLLPPGSSSKSLMAQSAMPLGSRFFIGSVFRNNFTRPNMTQAEFKSFNSILDQTLNKGADIFGGAIDFYSTRGLLENVDMVNCYATCSSESQTRVPLNLPSSPGRSNGIANTCKRVLDNFTYFKAGLQNIGLSVNGTAVPDFDSNKIQNIYEAFYLGETVEPELKESLIQAVEESKFLGYGSLDQWRLVFMMVCQTPYWQIL